MINQDEFSDVFPWNKNLETGIPVIDQQHKTLVDLINKLTRALVTHNSTEMSKVFEELIDYAKYHFETEEKIWKQYFENDEWFQDHQHSHDTFLPEILELKKSTVNLQSTPEITVIVKFLIRWLAFHIVESDKKMAVTILNIQTGKSLSEAKILADQESNNTVHILISTILSMYENATSQAIELLREHNKRIKIQHELEISNEKLQTLATTDQLTGLLNRRRFEEIFPQEIGRAQRNQHTLTFLMFDIDYFKKLNDLYGHIQGDNALKAVSKTLTRLCRRSGDYVFRLGGEEFGILITDHTSIDVKTFAENLRHAIEDLNIENKDSRVSNVLTISIGVSSHIPGSNDTIDTYLKEADEKLYIAKEKGRNQVIY